MGSVLRFGIILAACSMPAFASPLLEERGACNRDNLLRCYDPTGTNSKDIASRAAATAFCSSFLSLPVVTSTIATITPLSTVTSTVMTTDATEVVTSVSTSVFVEQSTITTTVPAAVAPARRAVDTVPAPACAATTYAPSAVSSACSCLGVTPSTTFVTATAPTSTNIAVSTIHDTATTTTQTTTTTTRTETTTSVVTAAATFTASNGQVYQTRKDVAFVGGAAVYQEVVASIQACVELCILPQYAAACIGVDYYLPLNLCQLVDETSPNIVYDLDWTIAYPSDSPVAAQ